MDSLQKTRNLLDALMDADDDELRETLGAIPVPMARGLLPIIPAMLPNTAEDLDEQIDQFTRFLDQLRSDPVE